MESGQAERAMSLLSRIRIPMTDAGEHENVTHLLNELSTRLPGRLEPLEWLVDTYGRTSDSFRMPDALAHLGDALVSLGKLERAKDTFQQLVDREPESDAAKRKLNDVLKKLGQTDAETAPADIVVVTEDLQTELPKAPAPKVRPGLEEPAASIAAETPSSAAPAEPELDEETQKFIAQSLTDVDLFASYGLTQKAIGLLEAILRRAPTHTPTLEKLLDFVLGAGDDRRTAELAAQLEHIHASRGDVRSGERFGELRRRFQRAAGLTDEEIGAAVAAAMPQPVETEPVEEPSMLDAAVAAADVQAAPGEASAQTEEVPGILAEAEGPEIEMVEPTDAESSRLAALRKKLTFRRNGLPCSRRPRSPRPAPVAAAPKLQLRPRLPCRGVRDSGGGRKGEN